MTNLSLTAISGFASVLSYVAVAVLMGEMPGIDTPADPLKVWVEGHRTQLLVGGYCWGLCVSATLVFLTGLWGQLEPRQPMLAMLGMLSGYAIFILSLAGFALTVASAYGVAGYPAATVKLLNAVNFAIICFTGFPTAVSMSAFIAIFFRDGIHPKLAWFGVIVVVAHLISAGAFASSGWLSPSGIGVYVAPVLYYAWIFAMSWVLWGKRRQVQVV